MSPKKNANAMWGGHFSAGPAEAMARINPSIDFDKALYKQDIQGSKAHADMLLKQAIISADDHESITNGLTQIEQEIASDNFTFSHELEDIHMNIEARLRELIGDAAGRLHTARSRNDQVATDFKLWTRDSLDVLDAQLGELQKALISRAEEHADTIMPGFTHLQVAQPVTFGHHLMAYVEMCARDRSRIADCRKRLNQSPLGAAALAGTPFPIDRHMTAEALGFDGPTRNSMDTVSDRDFAIEYLSVVSIIMTHLSRLAEEMVIWSSAQFKFITLSDSFTTGSSIMPQKRNPDAAELVRGKTGRVFGSLMSLLTTMKGLTLTYSKDMQEDKEPVFDAAETTLLCLSATTGMVQDMTVHADNMKAATERGFPTATDLADWLVRELGIPFRDAHHITGKAVCAAEEAGCALSDLPLETLQSIHPDIHERVFDVLTVEHSVASRTSYGGTAPERVCEAIAIAKKEYL